MSDRVREQATELLRDLGWFSSGRLSERTGLTRQALHHHVKRWLEEGWIVREGGGRSTRYISSRGGATFDRTFPTAGLEEESVRRDVVAWIEDQGVRRTDPARRVFDHVLTEIVNNAIDHSGADEVRVTCEVADEALVLEVVDHGVGAFERIRRELGFASHLEALGEVSKGKLTTQPEAHTGEGLFFSSKMVARFELWANGLAWIVDGELGDQTVREVDDAPGTRVRMLVPLTASPDPVEVFDRYAPDYEFDRTTCVVALFQHGTEFVSRSEGKRIVRRLEDFREVEFDFTGVEAVGQAFVDQVFRVWSSAHPKVRLRATGMIAPVEFMVRRGWPGWRSSGLDSEA